MTSGPVLAELLITVFEVAIAMHVGTNKFTSLHITGLPYLLEDVTRRCHRRRSIKLAREYSRHDLQNCLSPSRTAVIGLD